MIAPLRVFGFAALIAACTSTQAIPPNYAPAQAAISAADAVGAKGDPRAALHLKMARDQVVEAQVLMQKGKSQEASYALDCARTDAELALMVARETQARTDATRAKQDVQRLGDDEKAQ